MSYNANMALRLAYDILKLYLGYHKLITDLY